MILLVLSIIDFLWVWHGPRTKIIIWNKRIESISSRKLSEPPSALPFLVKKKNKKCYSIEWRTSLRPYAVTWEVERQICQKISDYINHVSLALSVVFLNLPHQNILIASGICFLISGGFMIHIPSWFFRYT